MPKDGKFVVAYDITEDKERYRVEQTLKNYGFRVQKSVFECRLTKSGLKRLVDDLEKISPKTGFVRIYRVPINIKHLDIGINPNPNIDELPIFIV